MKFPPHPDDQPSPFDSLPPDDVVRAFVTYPDEMASALAFIRPEHFRALEHQYLIAEQLRFRDRDGLVPTEKCFRAFVAHDLIIDDSDINGGYEEVMKLFEPLPARDLPNIRRNITEWAKKQAIRRIVDDRQAIEAIARGDSGPIRALLDEADAIGVEEGKSSLLTYAELMALDDTEDWIVNGILTAGEPMVIAGAFKTMKTSTTIDLALSIAAGGQFLGRYQSVAKRVLFISGETNRMVVKRKIEVIGRVRRLDKGLLADNFLLDTKLPRATKAGQLAALKVSIKKLRAEVVIIDPLYLCLDPNGGNVSSSDLFGMGPLLADLTNACLDGGATPIFVHHFNRKSDPHAWPTLRDLSQSGTAEFFRQWVLIGRAEAYGHDDHHQLNIVVGAGASGRNERLQVHIQDAGMGNDGIKVQMWEVDVQDGQELRRVAAEERDQEIRRFMHVLRRRTADSSSLSKTALREELHWSGGKMQKFLALMADRIEVYPGPRQAQYIRERQQNATD